MLFKMIKVTQPSRDEGFHEEPYPDGHEPKSNEKTSEAAFHWPL
jgi:hypothetical protein